MDLELGVNRGARVPTRTHCRCVAFRSYIFYETASFRFSSHFPTNSPSNSRSLTHRYQKLIPQSKCIRESPCEAFTLWLKRAVRRCSSWQDGYIGFFMVRSTHIYSCRAYPHQHQVAQWYKFSVPDHASTYFSKIAAYEYYDPECAGILTVIGVFVVMALWIQEWFGLANGSIIERHHLLSLPFSVPWSMMALVLLGPPKNSENLHHKINFVPKKRCGTLAPMGVLPWIGRQRDNLSEAWYPNGVSPG